MPVSCVRGPDVVTETNPISCEASVKYVKLAVSSSQLTGPMTGSSVLCVAETGRGRRRVSDL